MNPALEKIHSFGSLLPDWDGHGSDAISEVAIAAAAAVLARASRWPGLSFQWTLPTSEETILMQFGSGDGGLFKFEIDEDGDLGVMRKSPGCEPEFADLRWTGSDGFHGGTDWARALLTGEPAHPPVGDG
jgi:hypothetical protein